MKYTILFVDDNPVDLQLLHNLFASSPYNLLFAKGPDEALKLLEEGLMPAVIVSDQMMPQMRGCEFLTASRKYCPEAVRIMLTAYSDFEAAVDAINKCGLYRFLIKPWDKNDLKQVIDDAVAQYDIFLENRRLTSELIEKNEQLEKLNSQLESEVDEQYRALNVSYEEIRCLNQQLERKVVELEGRGRILHHLLTIHDLEDSLHIILEVVRQVFQVGWAAVYQYDDTSGQFSRAAVQGDMQLVPDHLLALEQVQKTFNDRKPSQIFSDNNLSLFYLPILKGEKCLGVAMVAKQLGDQVEPDNEEFFEAVKGFLAFLAIAISDAKIVVDMPIWDASLDDVLSDLMK